MTSSDADRLRAARQVAGCGKPVEAAGLDGSHTYATQWLTDVTRGDVCDACLTRLLDWAIEQAVRGLRPSQVVTLGFTLFESREMTDQYKMNLLRALLPTEDR